MAISQFHLTFSRKKQKQIFAELGDREDEKDIQGIRPNSSKKLLTRNSRTFKIKMKLSFK